MKVRHDCGYGYPKLELPSSVLTAKYKWCCPICGTTWFIVRWRDSSAAERIWGWHPNIRGWLWTWATKKVMR